MSGYQRINTETLIDEQVKVWAVFGNGLLPIAINWQNKLIKLKELIFTSTKRSGETKIINFVCSSKSANFELEYNTQNHQWKLIRMMPKE